jgi:hypothetical protein
LPGHVGRRYVYRSQKNPRSDPDCGRKGFGVPKPLAPGATPKSALFAIDDNVAERETTLAGNDNQLSMCEPQGPHSQDSPVALSSCQASP